MSATGEDQDMADALLVACGLTMCGAQPGEACRNTADGRHRAEPHWNRVVKGRRAVHP